MSSTHNAFLFLGACPFPTIYTFFIGIANYTQQFIKPNLINIHTVRKKTPAGTRMAASDMYKVVSDFPSVKIRDVF